MVAASLSENGRRCSILNAGPIPKLARRLGPFDKSIPGDYVTTSNAPVCLTLVQTPQYIWLVAAYAGCVGGARLSSVCRRCRNLSAWDQKASSPDAVHFWDRVFRIARQPDAFP